MHLSPETATGQSPEQPLQLADFDKQAVHRSTLSQTNCNSFLGRSRALTIKG
ncbi:MAG: hypothetical protein RM021_014845 [Nostoc sp. EkiNYC01]|nr:hypothetical protein [Nostoc sp. EkiNYC01]